MSSLVYPKLSPKQKRSKGRRVQTGMPEQVALSIHNLASHLSRFPIPAVLGISKRRRFESLLAGEGYDLASRNT